MRKIFLMGISLFCALTFQNVKAQNSHWANPSASAYAGTSVLAMYEDTSADLLYLGLGYYVHVFNGNSYPIMGTSFGANGVRAIIKYNGTLYVGGFSFPKFLSRWNGSAWDTTGLGANGSVFAFCEYNGDLYVGGNFTRIGGINATGIAKYDGSTWSSIGNFPFSYCYGISAISFYNGELYIGGSFGDSLSHVMNIARWNGSQWNTVGGGFHGGSDEVVQLETLNNILYIGGNFTAGAGNVGDYIAQWDGNTLSDVGGGMSGIGTAQIWALKSFHNELYAGGDFFYAGGAYACHIAKWDGTNWCGTNDTMNNVVASLGSFRDTLYMGGGFGLIDGDTIVGLAKWIGGNFGDNCGNTTGIQENATQVDGFVYPNPASNKITFNLNNNFSREIIITDQLGREILERKLDGEKQIEISVADLADGMYFFQLMNGETVASGKFIVKH